MPLFLAVFALATVGLLAGCGSAGEGTVGNSSLQTSVTNELSSAVDKAMEAPETTQAAAPKATPANNPPPKGGITVSPNDQQNLNILQCQINQATAGMSQQQANDYSDQALQEAMSKGTNMQTILAGRGYDCGWSALQSSRGQD